MLRRISSSAILSRAVNPEKALAREACLPLRSVTAVRVGTAPAHPPVPLGNRAGCKDIRFS